MAATGIGIASCDADPAGLHPSPAALDRPVSVQPIAVGGAGVQHSATSDRAALVALYDSAGGANWTNNTNWKSPKALGEWHGVTTDSTGRVTSVDLGSNNLTGSIPPQLGNLSKLWNLRLGYNDLTDSIPPELGNLSSLTDLYLDENDLTGPIPAKLGELASLRNLWLSGNSLTDSIPAKLGDLSTLTTLFLYENDLTGPIPADLGKLSGLRGLRLSGNRLTDSIPPELGDLASLTDLYLDDNELAGSIPPDLGDLSKLTSLWLKDNAGLNGPLPAELADTMTLGSFHYSGTDLCTPDDTGFQTWLADIDDHEGTVGCERAALEALYDSAGGASWTNKTNWKTARPLGEWHGVTTDSTTGRVASVVLDRNGLTGTIPPQLGNLDSLNALRLGNNRLLTGPIPPELGNLSNLEVLILQGDSLTGTIPRELGRLTKLKRLKLNGNSLTGTIPVELADLENLTELQLSSNRWAGTIPTWLATGKLNKLERLGLNNIGFTGAIPKELATGNLDALQRLELGGNKLTGAIPKELADLGLWMLWLGNNELTGTFPRELLKMRHMASLQLHNNAGLKGELPAELPDSMSGLRHFNYQGTGFCVPDDAKFRTWLAGLVWGHSGNGVVCDRTALEALYDSAGGASWTNKTNWKTAKPLGEWHGVKVDSTTGRVRTVRLENNGLTGTIPSQLGDLDGLKDLRLGNNPLLTGPIPRELGNLSNLEVLILQGDRLTGTIPRELGRLTKLKRLKLNGNDLTGTIPVELADLENLTELQLSSNRWAGTIPTWLATGQLNKLERLGLNNIGFTGAIPKELGTGNLDNLRQLELHGNKLTGAIPKELGDLGLWKLKLGDNKLTGTIPNELLKMRRMTILQLQNNAGLEGALPVEMPDSMNALKRFYYQGTGFCVPDDAAFRTWLAGVADHKGTGVVCSSSSSTGSRGNPPPAVGTPPPPVASGRANRVRQPPYRGRVVNTLIPSRS